MKLIIHKDSNAESPREWDNLFTMVCNHRSYSLGDTSNPFAGDSGSYEEDRKLFLSDLGEPDAIWFPIYMYDHSRIALSIEPFSCRWDSGQLGFMYVSKSKVRAEYGVKRISTKLLAQLEQVAKAEVEIYSSYVEGNCYGFTLKSDDEERIDSCWGFIGDFDKVKTQIKEHLPEETISLLEDLDYSDIKYD